MATATDPPSNSGIHQLDKDAYPPAESDDEDSFVVLDSYGPRTFQVEVEPISTTEIEKTLNSITETFSKYSLMSADNNRESMRRSVMNPNSYASVSADEIQKNVDNLIAENIKLKDTLAQNNVTMKVQVEKITKWQEEVQQVQESHKKKFSEMKVIIQELKSENSKLKSELETEKNKIVTNSEAPKTKSVPVMKANDGILQFELEAAHKKIKEMEKALDIIITEKQNLSSDITEYKKEIANYENEIKNLQASNDKICCDKSSWVVTESELKKDLDLIRSECESLKQANVNLTSSLEEATNKYAVISETLKEKESMLSSAQTTIMDLEETLTNTKQQLMASQMHITELKEQHTKEANEKAAEEENLLKKQDHQKQLFEDEITALRTQMDLFRKDYETERMLKENIITEKNAIVDELQLLHRRNAELMEEVDQLRSGYVPVRSEDVAASSPPSNNSPQQSIRYVCPICAKSFRSLLLLEDHLGYCCT